MSSGKDLELPHDIALFLTILIISSILVASATWIYLNPRPLEQFFAIGILGKKMMAEQYYPEDKPSIKLEDTVKWHITLYNHMGSVQYVSIRAKLLNQTTPPPDDMNHKASSVPFFKEIRYVLMDNETLIIPFYWSIEDVSLSNDSLKITRLKLNNETITCGLNTTAKRGYNFRIVLELWSYINKTSGFQFGWKSGEELRSAWVQIWFNLTVPMEVQNQTERIIVINPENYLLTNFQTDFKRSLELKMIFDDLDLHY